MEDEKPFNPAQFDPAKVPLDWTPPSADLEGATEEVRKAKDGEHLTTPVTHMGYGAAWWVTGIMTLELIIRLLRSVNFRWR